MSAKTEKIKKIAKKWDVSLDDAHDVIKCMMFDSSDAIVSDCEFAGTIDLGDPNMLCGHNGYWLAYRDPSYTGGGYIRIITNADPLDAGWDEDVADSIGLEWADFGEAFCGYEI
jgi:hypothetical protein